MNEFVKFYKEYGGVLDPKDIGDIREHMYRRTRLYEMLGIPSFAFHGIDLLDIGGGSGYNTLVFLLLGAKVDLVEPNEVAVHSALKLFEKYQIPKSQYTIYNEILESFKGENAYKVIIAEGFLHSLYAENRQEVIECIKKYANIGTYIVVTTMCEFSYFYEDLRRILGLILISKIEDRKQKIEILSRAFGSHLNNLKYAVRPVEDWVVDTILNPGGDVKLFSIEECVKYFGEGYEVVGMSPNLIPNQSWYKDMQYSYSKEISREFSFKKHLLIDRNFKDFERKHVKNQELYKELICFREYIGKFRREPNELFIIRIIEILQRILDKNKDLGEVFMGCVQESIVLLRNFQSIKWQNVASAKKISKAWGRGLQYISFVKNKE